jgi:exodeoxyribonuclease V alpha subunit
MRQGELRVLSPTGAARLAIEPGAAYPPELQAWVRDGDLDPGGAFLAWQLAQLPGRVGARERLALTILTARLLVAERAGSTRVALTDDDKQLLAKLPDVAGGPASHAPLVVEGDHLYSQRAHGCEERVASALAKRWVRRSLFEQAGLSAAVNAVARQSLVPPSAEQAHAVVTALSRHVAAISGGPGTGKTTTAITLVRALARLSVPVRGIALCAPTGKAASRLEEDLRTRLGQLAHRDPVDEHLLRDCPQAQTLHRLLGIGAKPRPGSTTARDPLPFQAVVVDESSMIDLVLMDRLLGALADTTLLVLLGDADQLPSVSAGAVFRDLGELGVRLEHGFRTGGMRALADLAHAVKAGDADRCAQLCTPRRHPDEIEGRAAERVESQHRDELLRRYHARVFRAPEVAALVDPAFVMHDGALDAPGIERLHALADRLGRSRILAVTHERPTGVERTNAFLHDLHGGGAHFLPGEPVLMLRNDYARELWNGDQGIAIRVRQAGRASVIRVAFLTRGGWRIVDPQLLGNALTLGFALSVHKSQGSELDAVTLLLPDLPCPLLTRELLYTAVSRARSSVLLCGSLTALKAGVTTTESRSSGIAARLDDHVTALTRR